MTTKEKKLTPIIALTVAATFAMASDAQAAMVAHFPVSSATDTATLLNDTIDDGTHGVTDGNGTTAVSGSTAAGIAGSSIVNNIFRGGDVLSTIEGHRYRAGTQSIDLNSGFSWTLWVNVAASNVTDAGADSIIGTRSASGGVWNKMDLLNTGNWNGAVPNAGNYTGGTLADSAWHFIAYVGDTTNRQIYKDGVLIGQDTTFTVATFNGNMEIGGSSPFSGEDVTGLYDDIAIWNERLTTDEAFSLYEISSPASLGGLLYDAGQFNLLKQIHDAAAGSVLIGGLQWSYATGLTGSAGLNGSPGNYNLVLNAGADTGLIGQTPVVVPVPAALPAGLAMLGLAGMRRRGV